MTERGRSRKKPAYQLKIARERIDILFKEAAKADDHYARRYIKLAKKIGMRYNLRLGERKRLFCKHCFTMFKKSKTRTKNGFLLRACRHCGKTTRLPVGNGKMRRNE